MDGPYTKCILSTCLMFKETVTSINIVIIISSSRSSSSWLLTDGRGSSVVQQTTRCETCKQTSHNDLSIKQSSTDTGWHWLIVIYLLQHREHQLTSWMPPHFVTSLLPYCFSWTVYYEFMSSSSSSTTVGSMPVGVWRHSYYRCPPLPI